MSESLLTRDPLWNSKKHRIKKPITLKTIKSLLHDDPQWDQGYNLRRNAFLRLDASKNFDFIEKFGPIHKNEAQLCKQLFTQTHKDYVFSVDPKVLGKGKTGTAWKINVHNDSHGGVKSLVMKKMKMLEPLKESLPLRVYPFDMDATKMNSSILYNSVITNNGRAIIDIPSTDHFVNQTCVSMALCEILKDNPHYVQQLDVFVCDEPDNDAGFWNTLVGNMRHLFHQNPKHDEWGYTIMDHANKGTLYSFLKDPQLAREPQFDNTLMNIIRQVFDPMSILQSSQHGFIHADLKTPNVFLSSENNKLVCKVADFDKSSVFWNGFRFYNDAIVTKAYEYGGFVAKRFSEIWETTDYPYPISTSGSWPHYRLNRRHPVSLYSQSSPIPMYSSYDMYTFLYSLANQVPVWTVLQQNSNQFTKFWRSIWEPTNMESVNRALALRHTHISEAHDKQEIEKRMFENVSLHATIHDLESHHWMLKADVAPIYDAAGAMVPQAVHNTSELVPKVSTKSKNLKINATKDFGMCKSPCNQGKCKAVRARHWMTDEIVETEKCTATL